MLATYAVNAIAPVRVVATLLPMLRDARAAKVVHVSSGLGSIGDNTSGGYYAYRMSKAALNMAAKSMAVDLRRFGISAAVINPGWVRTDMGGPGAQISSEESVRGMLAAIDGLALGSTGSFLDWRRDRHPW
jgi:NAD(P)-dependent dehydrogenase (short-subunit alcohol dehydrogenase family)